MKNRLIIFALSILLFSNTFGQKKKDLNIDFMISGSIYAQSSIEDTLSFGGYGGSENSPRLINLEDNFPENGFFLKIDTTAKTTINESINAYKLYIVNKSDSIIKLEASDSRLDVVAEVYYRNDWKPIEYLPSSWCGNSYHSVYLQQNEYWEFIVPKFTGKIKTKLRYKLILNSKKSIYSNEIVTMFNEGQLKKINNFKNPYSE